jgi:hypothetical protein
VYFSGLTPDAINITPSGDIVLGREIVPSEEIADSLVDLNEQLATASTLVDYLHRLFSFLERLKPTLAFAL